MPRSASSNLPRRSAAAPGERPFSWPKSSLSISSVGIAAQLTFTNGPPQTDSHGGCARRAAPCRCRTLPTADRTSDRHLGRLLHGCWNTGAIPSSSAPPRPVPVALVLALQVRPRGAFLTTSSTRSRASGSRENRRRRSSSPRPRRPRSRGRRSSRPRMLVPLPDQRSRSMPLPSGSRTSSRYSRQSRGFSQPGTPTSSRTR